MSPLYMVPRALMFIVGCLLSANYYSSQGSVTNIKTTVVIFFIAVICQLIPFVWEYCFRKANWL
jgi:hypothetical protein